MWKYFGNIVEKVRKFNFHSFVQFHSEAKVFLRQRKEVVFEAMEKLLGERGPKMENSVSIVCPISWYEKVFRGMEIF